MSKLQTNIGLLAAKVFKEAMASGLTWDESIAALGVAAKVLADGAEKEGDGTTPDCHAHAQKRFAEGFAQQVQVVIAGSDMTAFKAAYEENPAFAASANTKIVFKH